MQKVITRQDMVGQSIIEVIVAVAILIIIAGTSMIAVLGSFSTTRLAEEETEATLIAVEGLEAVQSIRNQGWDDPFLATNCSAGCGLDNTSGWMFSGSSDIHTITTGRDFVRTVIVSQVERDVGGDIVPSGGTVDPDTYLIASVVTWDFTPSRQNTVDMFMYLTKWQDSVSGDVGIPPPTPVPTPTPTPVPTPTSTPSASNCNQLCQGLNYSVGTCRKNAQDCVKSGETLESTGSLYCTGGPSSDTCCCAL